MLQQFLQCCQLVVSYLYAMSNTHTSTASPLLLLLLLPASCAAATAAADPGIGADTLATSAVLQCPEYMSISVNISSLLHSINYVYTASITQQLKIAKLTETSCR
jgi:hypothetical protein